MRWLLLVVCTLAVGCGAGDPPSTVPIIDVETPITITGRLDLPVEEGPVGDDGISEVNFGWLVTDDGDVLVEIPGSVVRDAGLSREEFIGGGRFELHLPGPAEQYDPSALTYLVGQLTPVE